MQHCRGVWPPGWAAPPKWPSMRTEATWVTPSATTNPCQLCSPCTWEQNLTWPCSYSHHQLWGNYFNYVFCTISFHFGWTRPLWSCRCRRSGARPLTPSLNSLWLQTTNAAPGTGWPYTRYIWCTIFHHYLSCLTVWCLHCLLCAGGLPTSQRLPGVRVGQGRACDTGAEKKTPQRPKIYLHQGWISAQVSSYLSHQQVSFSEEDLPRDDCEYMLGYYSNNMNSIVGLSTTIQVC